MRIAVQILYLLFSTLTCFGQKSHFLKTQDGVLYYETIGDGKPILIINGGPGFSSEGFKDIATELSSLGYKSILFDQRGTGKSTLKKIDTSTISMRQMALDIESIRKDLGIDKWILFGHSFGGMLANYYTSIYPEKVLAMIHSSSGGLDLHLLENAQENLYARLTNQEIDSLQFWRTKMLNQNNYSNRFKYNSVLASAYVYDKKHIPTVANRLMQGNTELNRMVWNDMRAINFDCKNRLKSFDKPVLILQGKQDILPDIIAYRTNSVFSKSTIFFIDKCGHYGWLDQRKIYLEKISIFLKSLDIKQ
ncbi:alpha/beta fold hydrolase [Winogradskyella pulchriflava]|uniref:Alpha/beta fold hydrolase n=1 Tax=Winogradskyella pulchriflava TaxID=1110688 RepID=A0ABV6QAY2_9FLAO